MSVSHPHFLIVVCVKGVIPPPKKGELTARPPVGTVSMTQRVNFAVTRTAVITAGGAANKTPRHAGHGLETPDGGSPVGGIGPIG